MKRKSRPGEGQDNMDSNRMASKKRSAKTKKKMGWGGRRPGAGRPPGTGRGPSPGARINRVVAMLSNDELKALRGYAKQRKLPVGTAAHHIIAQVLKRQR